MWNDLSWLREAVVLQKWEYYTYTGSASHKIELDRQIDEALQDAGSNGWELVSVHVGTGQVINMPSYVYLFFKRPGVSDASID